MGLLDKIHKLFKTDAYKLKVILAQDIQEEVNFVEFTEDYGDVVDDHFTTKFVHPLIDAKDSILKDKDPKKAMTLIKKAKITIPTLEKFFDKEIFNGNSRLHKVPLLSVLKQKNRYSYININDAVTDVQEILAQSLIEHGINELIEGSIIKVCEGKGHSHEDLVNAVINKQYDVFPKEWVPVLKYCQELDAIAGTVIKKYLNLGKELAGLVEKYYKDAVNKYYDPKK